MENTGIKKLKRIAELSGLTQASLAKHIGITQGALSHYYVGRRKKVDPMVAMKIVRAFPAIKLEDFYGG